MLNTKLEPLTERLKTLPIDSRGYPVPWFVAWIDGKPEFRAADARKWHLAIRDSLCWVCGGKMGAHKTFVIGPMCGVNRVTSEPPCHLDCAEWSARNCPFLSNPNMVRNEKNLEGENPGGIMIKRNPGVTLLWTTKKFTPFKVPNGHLISLGEPTTVTFYAKGKIATREEIDDAIASGCPALEAVAKAEDKERGDEKSSIELRLAKEKFIQLINQQTQGGTHAN